jgi:hypothetical protein
MPEMSDKDKAKLYDEYRRALRGFPRWAVAAAYDEWVKTGSNRPSPNNIVVLARKALKPLTDEIARREKIEAEMAEYRERQQRPKSVTDCAKIEEITQRAGYTAKRAMAVKARPMARNEVELYATADPDGTTHWTQKVSSQSPEMKQLRAARMNNPLMRQGMSEAEKNKSEDQNPE